MNNPPSKSVESTKPTSGIASILIALKKSRRKTRWGSSYPVRYARYRNLDARKIIAPFIPMISPYAIMELKVGDATTPPFFPYVWNCE
jgi:hypothetical protein